MAAVDGSSDDGALSQRPQWFDFKHLGCCQLHELVLIYRSCGWSLFRLLSHPASYIHRWCILLVFSSLCLPLASTDGMQVLPPPDRPTVSTFFFRVDGYVAERNFSAAFFSIHSGRRGLCASQLMRQNVNFNEGMLRYDWDTRDRERVRTKTRVVDLSLSLSLSSRGCLDSICIYASNLGTVAAAKMKFRNETDLPELSRSLLLLVCSVHQQRSSPLAWVFPRLVSLMLNSSSTSFGSEIISRNLHRLSRCLGVIWTNNVQWMDPFFLP